MKKKFSPRKISNSKINFRIPKQNSLLSEINEVTEQTISDQDSRKKLNTMKTLHNSKKLSILLKKHKSPRKRKKREKNKMRFYSDKRKLLSPKICKKIKY